MATDYKNTVFLPRTDFPMRGGLAQKEPELLARWEAMDLYGQMRKARKGKPKFVLHDGPPFTSGNIHIGTAMQKTLKDFTLRLKFMTGFDVPFVPGWDCHGLPIEWKIEEKYRAAKKDRKQVPVTQFLAECRAFAQHWITVMTGEFKRLGIIGDWTRPYSTMAPRSEARIVREIHKFLLNGSLFQGVKPVMWSVVEKTALAEAEIEYQDVTSTTLWVKFPIIKAKDKALKNASIVIWTTTPWTLPANRAVAYGKGIDYVLVAVTDAEEGSLAKVGDQLVLAKNLVEATAKTAKCTLQTLDWFMSADTDKLEGVICAHPLRGQGYDFDVPVLPGEFVTADQGTGFVHIAPGHGADDFELGRAYGLEVTRTVDDDGSYYAHVPLFAGKRVYTPHGKPGDANPAVIEALQAPGALLATGKLTHSYPHSWRSKAPVIFRTTPQWFIALDDDNKLREKALKGIDDTRWLPAQGRNRIRSMVEGRTDWCISRQRVWGVPLGFFVNKSTGEPLKDKAVLERVAAAFEQDGLEAWHTRPASDFLGPQYKAEDYTQVMDIVDVWFESGTTHAYVLENNPDLHWPADLYLEGSDQHRGWFQSSLLEACGTRGRAPYKTVVTHGYVLDDQGRKLSKSLGNGVPPQKIVDKEGADILRLWVAGSDYTGDLRIGQAIIDRSSDVYRRLRNTLRYLLGALADFREEERLPADKMPELERWVLHRLWEIDQTIRKAIDDYDFHAIYT
ncbi:MAG: isoleucine--tRNA ligase, partial [Pseudomonadota bacterium]|nr:isoleucine--tRNA ligase [Pseudomonadota bacterium]